MPLQLGERYSLDSKVVEILEVKTSGNYRFERYKVLDVYSGIHHAFIFYVDDKEYQRGWKYKFIDELIEFHIKHEILGLYPKITINADPSF